MATREEKVAIEKEIYEDISQKCEELSTKMESSSDRYVNFADRTTDTCYDLKTIKGFYEGQYQTIWRDVKVLKTCTTLHIYQHMLQKEKPKTIIELGTWQGGSTLWLSDMCKALELNDTKIVSMDLNLDLLHPKIKGMTIDNIQFMEGDATQINKCLTPEILKIYDSLEAIFTKWLFTEMITVLVLRRDMTLISWIFQTRSQAFFSLDVLLNLPHPWLVIDDCHVVCDDVMKYINDYVNVGDYYIIEDTHPAMQQLTGSGLPGDNSRGLSSDNYPMLAKAMETLDGIYQIDTLYNDFFGAIKEMQGQKETQNHNLLYVKLQLYAKYEFDTEKNEIRKRMAGNCWYRMMDAVADMCCMQEKT